MVHGDEGGSANPTGGRDYQPRPFYGVTVSGTFTDLEKHRTALIKAIKTHGLTEIAMENSGARPDVDVIDSSLQMVRDGAAYAGVISLKYGQTPTSPDQNPDRLSITELEFNEALRLGRPILLFIMSDDHDVKKAGVETNAAKLKKLNAFRERAKLWDSSSKVHRVYDSFSSLEDFTTKANQAVSRLRLYLDENARPAVPTQAPPAPAPTHDTKKSDPIPKPPELYAEPRYIGTHKFLGRRDKLEVLNEWAAAADPYPVLLFDAIGGTGKSILTWTWMTEPTARKRTDWAGRFWYSFYEKGADMGDFCRRALAYMTETPLEELRKKKTAELREPLLHLLQARPWLLVLDGLERVLVAYNRLDAAELRDEEANRPADQIAQRDPCAAIHPEDDDLLRSLAAAAPSKLLITSRLVPRVLLNPAQQAIPGVRREPLPGLRAEDAEQLLKSCGVTGYSQAIQSYLKSNCDCHPLVIGVLAGLILDYLPDRGNFDAWLDDPEGAGKLNLAELKVERIQNHILTASIAGLPENSRKLLSMMALLSVAVDYLTLNGLNPFLPPEPEEIEEADDPRNGFWWKNNSEEVKRSKLAKYEAASKRRHASLEAWRRSTPCVVAGRELTAAIADLERRGLLQYDKPARRFDLHPVVRGVAAGGLKAEEKEGYGQRVVDYFSAKAHSPYDEAETLDDVAVGLHIVRTRLKMGQFQEACDAYRGDFSYALLFNLGANAEVLSLLRPFFPQGWGVLPDQVSEDDASYLANEAGVALSLLGDWEDALAASGASLASELRTSNWLSVCSGLYNISVNLGALNRLGQEDRCAQFNIDLSALADNAEEFFCSRLVRFTQLTRIGCGPEARELWDLLDPMGRNWTRASHRPGEAEYSYACFRYMHSDLREEDLIRAEELARAGRNRDSIRKLHRLRGAWRLDREEWTLAMESFGEALRMAHEVGQQDAGAEARLALARFHVGRVEEARHEAERLSQVKKPPDLPLAELWMALGERERAKKHTLAAYKWAWADGEPYVLRYELNKARALLEKLGVEIPNLPPYDPAKDGKFPCEDEVVAAIARLRAEKESKTEKKG
jgi:hypothetical protein